MRRTRIIALAALLGCDSHPTTVPTPIPTSIVDPNPNPNLNPVLSPSPPTLSFSTLAALRDSAVTDTSYARRVLFSWTTPDQIAILRRDQKLLLGTELPSGPTPYVERLTATANTTGPFADVARLLLLHPSLRLRRYAWPRPWPTRLGATESAYGTELIRVALRPDAIIARYDPSRADVFSFQDLDARAVSVAEALAEPARIAAVFHVRTDSPIAHREYVLCNESMVSEWSIATPDAASAIRADISLLSTLGSASLRAEPAAPSWTGDPGDTGSALFAASLAFDMDRYRATPAALDAIARALRDSTPAGAPLAVTPKMRFATEAVVPRVAIRKLPVRVARVV